MLRIACLTALAASASALVAPPARGANAVSARAGPLFVEKGSIVRIMRPESCAAVSEPSEKRCAAAACTPVRAAPVGGSDDAELASTPSTRRSYACSTAQRRTGRSRES